MAFDAGARVESVYHAPGAMGHPGAAAVIGRAEQSGTRVFALRAGVLERVADTATPQPVCGVVGFVDVSLEALLGATGRRGPLIVAVDVRDPGNVGALLRVADGADAAGVILCEGTADLYNPKTVRASAGSLFNVPIVLAGPAPSLLTGLGQAGIRRLGTVARGGQDYAAADLGGVIALVLGNEANGLDEEAARLLDGWLSIPLGGRAESLNVAMAASILCFEIARRARVAGSHAGPGPS